MRTPTITRAAARRLTALCVAGMTALALSGCGSDDTGSGSETPAAAGESAAPSATPTAPAELTQETFVEAISASEKTMTSAHMEMTYSGDAFAAAGMADAPIVADVNIAAEKPEMHMTMSTQGMNIDMILVGGEAFISMGDLTEGKYLYMTEAELAADPDFSGMADSIKADLGSQVEGLADGITSFEKSGTDVVDGTDVTLYTLQVDPTKITAEAADLEPEMLKQVGDMTVVYALDGDNFPRKADMTMTIAGQPVTVSTLISKVNEPVAITAPAADQTIAYSEMAG